MASKLPLCAPERAVGKVKNYYFGIPIIPSHLPCANGGSSHLQCSYFIDSVTYLPRGLNHVKAMPLLSFAEYVIWIERSYYCHLPRIFFTSQCQHHLRISSRPLNVPYCVFQVVDDDGFIKSWFFTAYDPLSSFLHHFETTG